MFLCLLAGCCRQGASPEVRAARISSGSMAEQFFGPHWQVTCADCGYTFRCGVEHPPVDSHAVCPNCGFRKNVFPTDAAQPGMAVEVVSFHGNPTKRWQVAAFYDSQDKQTLAVKRVVGLPGETISISGGDLLIGNVPVEKTLDQLRQVAQMIHDDSFRPQSTKDLPPRWRGADSRSGSWQATPHGYVFSPNGNSSAAVEPIDENFAWLSYDHWSCFQTPQKRTASSPVMDNYGYNQGLSRQLNEIRDIMLACRVRTEDNATLAVQVRYRGEWYLLELLPRENVVRWKFRNELIEEIPTSAPLVGDWFTLEVACCDGRLLLGINQHEEFARRLSAGDETADDEMGVLMIGARGGHAEVEHLVVQRDIHYLAPLGRSDAWTMGQPLGPAEYFVLGDNPPNSTDSRETGPIKANQLMGTVQKK